ncbi:MULTISPECIES: substrate-binding domain-containing protein [Paraburkholderia]|uniref:LysR family transcriptional regulator of molybdate metabolism n=1 Tax=Paraburkholderia tropica TaxID=92647 RepID=A0A1A5XKY5_9BURK|nr:MULTISPECIES: substrate-binding domain-containing protein [Paraburkholderia]MBB2979353.1 molybdate transport repressor ModE-like protein [Paraburkholderia tropica]MBB3001853.1 molybdate transport repressor ModE-like protein [Paraburkholderia tropica]MBB6321236.1 molybdate transport repressor ModE-like protein [Paraburkholderia tropica]MDE1143124.1 substrate-binding domain-containing protein [Paraburkholderia tropica]OBR53773.1 LysR family transcriptional regulator [Paraburkholderia tropica]
MIKVECQAQLVVRDADGREASLTDVVPLLALVAEEGSIAQAAQRKGLSYRHAWGLLREVEERLGGALIAKARGRGSVLSELGEAVLRSQRLCGERLQGNLQALASEVASDLNRWLAPDVQDLRIHASHGYAVATLVTALVGDQVPVEIKYRDSADAISALARGECDLAGFHLPRGDFREACADAYRNWLDPQRHVLIHLTRRKQGLFVGRGNPRQVTGLADLARGDIRFVNRQPGSGTRMLIDLLLTRIGVDPERVNGYASSELTHSAIAAFVASGMADVGFGVEPAAHHFGLDFIPIVDEDYFFACDRGQLEREPLAAVLELLRGAPFRQAVAQLEGYDPDTCGDIVPLDEGWAGAR